MRGQETRAQQKSWVKRPLHSTANIVYLDIAGLEEPLGVTDTHPIWSETRQDFVVAGQLQIGEQFRTVTGQTATLTKIHPHRGPPEMVFNLEVDGQHVYHVASSGLLVHNSCPMYHGTDSVSANDILSGGLNPDKLRASPDPDSRGLFLTPVLSDAEDYARLRAFERGGEATVLEADRAALRRFLEPVPHGIDGERMIPIDKFLEVPNDILKVAGQ